MSAPVNPELARLEEAAEQSAVAERYADARYPLRSERDAAIEDFKAGWESRASGVDDVYDAAARHVRAKYGVDDDLDLARGDFYEGWDAQFTYSERLALGVSAGWKFSATRRRGPGVSGTAPPLVSRRQRSA